MREWFKNIGGRRIGKIACACVLTFALLFSLCSACVAKKQPDQISYVIGISQANMREPWRLVLTQEIREEAAKHSDVRLVITDATDNSEKQIADIQKLLDFGVDLMIVSPCDVKKVTPVVSDVYQSIPVIVLDRVVEGYDYSLFIGPDNELIGKQAGKSVSQMLNGKGTVLELCGSSASQASIDRSEGFSSIIDETGDIQVEQVHVVSESRDSAEDIVRAYGTHLRDIDAIFAHNDYMALGASRALEQLGYEDIRIVGVDGFTGENRGIDLVRRGIIDETITCPTGGREAVQYALEILQEVSGVPKQVILRSHSVTKENADAYEAGLNRSYEEPDKIIDVGYAQVGTESAWRLANTQSIKTAAKEFGINLIYEDCNQSQERQIEALRRFIEMDVDVIVLSHVVDSGWDEILEEAQEADIPVLLSDRKVSTKKDDMYMTFIGADFLEEGRRAMRWVAETMEDPEECVRIMEIEGTVGASPSEERSQGFKEVMQEYPNCDIVYSSCGDFTYEGGKQVVEEYINSHDWDIDVIFSQNDDMALGAAEALENNGITPGVDVKLISVDGARSAFEALIDGRLNCVVECSPLLGPQLMKAIKDLMAGKELPLRIITDEKVYTQENAQKYIRSRKY